MSIEQDLNRIANALEGLLAHLSGGSAAPKTTAAKPAAKPATPVPGPAIDLPPGVEEVPGPGVDVAPAIQEAPGPKTPDELAKFGQTIIAAAGQERTKPFVDFVRGKVLTKYGTEVTNLCKVPADKVGEVVAALVEYTKKNGIKVPGVQ
ncbi:MAG: hypothetical protein WC551_10340 [Patescibacteria group bacterium]